MCLRRKFLTESPDWEKTSPPMLLFLWSCPSQIIILFFFFFTIHTFRNALSMYITYSRSGLLIHALSEHFLFRFTYHTWTTYFLQHENEILFHERNLGNFYSSFWPITASLERQNSNKFAQNCWLWISRTNVPIIKPHISRPFLIKCLKEASR